MWAAGGRVFSCLCACLDVLVAAEFRVGPLVGSSSSFLSIVINYKMKTGIFFNLLFYSVRVNNRGRQFLPAHKSNKVIIRCIIFKIREYLYFSSSFKTIYYSI